MMVVVLILGYGSWSDGRGSWSDGPMVMVQFLGRGFDRGYGRCRGSWFLVMFLGRAGGSGCWLVVVMVGGCGDFFFLFFFSFFYCGFFFFFVSYGMGGRFMVVVVWVVGFWWVIGCWVLW